MIGKTAKFVTYRVGRGTRRLLEEAFPLFDLEESNIEKKTISLNSQNKTYTVNEIDRRISIQALTANVTDYTINFPAKGALNGKVFIVEIGSLATGAEVHLKFHDKFNADPFDIKIASSPAPVLTFMYTRYGWMPVNAGTFMAAIITNLGE